MRIVDIEGILEEVVIKVMGHASRKTRFGLFQWTGIVSPPLANHNSNTTEITVKPPDTSPKSNGSFHKGHPYFVSGVEGAAIILILLIPCLFFLRRRAKKRALAGSAVKDPVSPTTSSDESLNKPELEASVMERAEIDGLTYYGPEIDGFEHGQGELAIQEIYEMSAREGIGNEMEGHVARE
jgi:hypothetical protein